MFCFYYNNEIKRKDGLYINDRWPCSCLGHPCWVLYQAASSQSGDSKNKKEAQNLLDEATTKYNELLHAAREEAIKVGKAAEAESKERRLEIQRIEKRANQKEEALERKLEAVERRDRDLDSRKKDIEKDNS